MKMKLTGKMRLAVLLGLALLVAPAPVAAAALPLIPHYFYGTVRIDGTAAPIGTTIEARAPGVLTGPFNPIVISQAGQYGNADPSIAVPRLLVQGEIAEGAAVEFYVNGVKATQTVAWHSGQVTQLDLNVNLVLLPLTIITDMASYITTSAAILSGSLTQLGGAAMAMVNFQWGPTQAYGYETPWRTVSVPGTFAATVDGLPPDTLIHYRAKAVAGQTATYGADQTFRTSAMPPPVSVDVGSGNTGSEGSAAGAGAGGASGGTESLPTALRLGGLSGDSRLRIDSSGRAQGDVKLRDAEGKVTISINSGTSLRSGEGGPLMSLFLTVPMAVPPAPAPGAVVMARELGPTGATFSPPITLTLAYDPAKLPNSVEEKDLAVAFWDGSTWIPLETTVDTAAKTVSAKVSHFTLFAVLGKITPRFSSSIAIDSLDVAGSTVKVMVSVKDFTLVAPQAGNVPGEGHIRYYLDAEIPAAHGNFRSSTQTSVTWENLAPGSHTLGMQLVNNNETPLDPPVMVTIKVNVSAPAAIPPAPPSPAPTAAMAAPTPTPPPALTPAPLRPAPSPSAGPGRVNWIFIATVAGLLVIQVLVLLLGRKRGLR